MWLHLKYLLKEGWEPRIAFRIFTSGNSLSLVAQTVKHLPTMQDTRVQSLHWEDLLEKAIHSSILAWKIPWTKEAGRLQFMGSQRVGHDWATSLSHSPNNLILFEILNSDQKDVRESKHTAERTHEASGSQWSLVHTCSHCPEAGLPAPWLLYFMRKSPKVRSFDTKKASLTLHLNVYNFSRLVGAGFPGGASDKEPTGQCRRHMRYKFNPWVGKSPGRRTWQPTPEFLPGNPMDRGAWWATIHRDAKSRTRLSTHGRQV